MVGITALGGLFNLINFNVQKERRTEYYNTLLGSCHVQNCGLICDRSTFSGPAPSTLEIMSSLCHHYDVIV